jgi:FkbM family methyltransferase
MKVKNILHIGGYVGEEAEDYQEMGADFVFVEPVPEYAQKIRDRGYKVIEKAVGKSGSIAFYKREYASSYLKHRKHRGVKIEVEGVELKVLQNDLGQVFDMLVIDAQGATLDILKSGALDEFKVIVCEGSKSPRYVGEAPMNEIIAYMNTQGFDLVYPFKHTGHDIYDLVFLKKESL